MQDSEMEIPYYFFFFFLVYETENISGKFDTVQLWLSFRVGFYCPFSNSKDRQLWVFVLC